MLVERNPTPPAYRGVVQATRDDRRIFFDTDEVKAWLGSTLEVPTLACDIETYGLGAAQFAIKCVTFSDGFTSAILDPRDPWQAATVAVVIDAAPGLVFHNAAFDVPSLIANGLMTYDHIAKVYDTLMYARLSRPDTMVGKSLEDLTKAVLGWTDLTSIGVVMKAAGFATQDAGYKGMDIDSMVYCNGAMLDTRATIQLVKPLRAEGVGVLAAVAEGPWKDWAAEDPAAMVEREQVVNRLMLHAGARGMAFDAEYYAAWKSRHDKTIDSAAAALTAEGLEPGDGAKLVTRLAELGALPAKWPRTGKTQQLAARAADIEGLTHPLAKLHLDFKQLTRIQGYLAKCEDMASATGRVHPMAGILGAAATGRMSYKAPELQQFSSDARGVLCADPGQTLVSIDWSAIEPIMLANIAGQQSLIDAYEAGEDIYGPVMVTAGVSRKVAKVVWLAGTYGQGKDLLASNLSHARGEHIDVDTAEAIQRSVMDAIPQVEESLNTIKVMGTQHGYVVTVAGRPLSIPAYPNRFNGRLQYAGYKGQNYTIQGSAYDQLADTLVRGWDAGLAGTCRLAMHDEVVVDNEAAAAWRELMMVPSAALCRAVDRTPVLRTDMVDMGVRWTKPE